MISPSRTPSLPESPAALPMVDVLGVPVTNATKEEASAMFDGWIGRGDGRCRGVYIVNAHTLNIAAADPSFLEVLCAGDVVFGDGTGVRIAARMRGMRMRDNLVGTDLMPYFFASRRERGYRYFLLGATDDTVQRAAGYLRTQFPGMKVVGARHGYVSPGENASVVREINAATPDVMLVAMGNPIQERWIHDNRAALHVPVTVGVGGLFDHWGGNLKRAPLWVRRIGFEWLQILLQQPGLKWRRYLLGNPKFIALAVAGARRRRA